MYELLIKNASVIDGSGEPAYSADIAVKNGKICLKPNLTLGSEQVIDATGLILSPGFIDAHSHGDMLLGDEDCALSRVSQGITTECTGQCGESMFPVSEDPEKRNMFASCTASYLKASPFYKDAFSSFTSMEHFVKHIQTVPQATNYTLMTGHRSLRIAAMGFDARKPTTKEMDHMKAMLRESMEHGSKGLSTGLIYSPSCYADEEELTELCKVVAEYDGIYTTHLRNEAAGLEDSVREAIRIAENSGCRLDLSHHKVCGRDNWGASERTLKMIDEAHARGVQIALDVYPYTATGTYLNICLPKEFFANGPEKMQELLKDPTVRTQLTAQVKEIDGRYRHCGGFENIIIINAPQNPEAKGMSVSDYARSLGRDEFDVYYDLLCANGYGAMAAYFSMCEEDLKRILLHPKSFLGTDICGIIKDTPCHPRAFGSFTTCLGKFVREEKLMPLETMIHKMTQAPAEFLQIKNKGLIAEGYDADLVLFDPATVNAQSSFTNSHALSEGIRHVIVSGEIVYQNKQLTGKFPGKFLPHQR